VSNVGTIAIEEILPHFQHTGGRDYVGRHRIAPTAPLAVRAAHRIVEEWTKPRAWTTAIGQRIANTLSDDQADKVYDLVTGETFREAARTISSTWRAMDRAAYGRIPKTWRHRLEARHRARQILDDHVRNTELWWAGRQADYAPALGLHTPTQPLHIIKEKTNA
jgi:hypothetical protein